MWRKYLLIIFLFCFFALLQNSFFTYFNLFGGVPNLIFALFFLLIFFANQNSAIQVVLWAVVAGFFLDIFSYSFIAPSIILLVVLGLIIKKIQSTLKTRDDNYPAVYYVPLFVFSFLAYALIISIYLNYIEVRKIAFVFSFNIIFSLIYSLIFAELFFYIYKRWLKSIR